MMRLWVESKLTKKVETYFIAVLQIREKNEGLFWLVFFFRAAPVAYGGSQTRGRIGAIAASLRHSHSNGRSEPHLQLTPQLMAMLDP